MSRGGAFAWATAVFAMVFLGVLFEAPLRAEIGRRAAAAPDGHFERCAEARAAGRHDIPWWEPSYRPWMDGDNDGVACEDPRFGFSGARYRATAAFR